MRCVAPERAAIHNTQALQRRTTTHSDGKGKFLSKKKTTNHFSVQGKRVKGNTFAMNGVSVCRVSGRGVFFYPIES